MTLARSGYSQRIGSPIGGNRYAGGGLFQDVPLDAFNLRDWYVYFEDFDDRGTDVGTTVFATSTRWDEVDVVAPAGAQTLNPSSFISQVGDTGWLVMDSDATDGDGVSVQSGGGLIPNNSARPVAGKTIVYECRVKHEDWDVPHWFVGLAEHTTTAVMDLDGDMRAATQYAGFHHNGDDDADGIPRLIIAGGNDTEVTVVPTETIAAGTDDTFRRFGFRITGTDVIDFYVDGVKVATSTIASAWDGAAGMTISFGNVMNSAAGLQLSVDYVCLAQSR